MARRFCLSVYDMYGPDQRTGDNPIRRCVLHPAHLHTVFNRDLAEVKHRPRVN